MSSPECRDVDIVCVVRVKTPLFSVREFE